MAVMPQLNIRKLEPNAFADYGFMLGGPVPEMGGLTPAFSNEATDFWQEHVFSTGQGGETEILWVNYRSQEKRISSLEVHVLTEQAIIPLTARIIHIVALSASDGSPDLSSVAAFEVPVGQGVCMRPGCWHATRVQGGQATCVMLTRRSTTADLISHLTSDSDASESRIVGVPEHVLVFE
ncbi:ureidoglycolate lyase [Pusillimonas sp. ANT_WB101]|uniref:ureidoglycolate lyase n=1 Tax=Pusillimonas sp. ANT_WB101 TaxID=2597356 RepID=UPI0011EE71BE|nr:ureidoglycolate lyase [Pusillimonas sp. ANT_WB101]KAA0892906.1 ureidoglycolate hydrolase [Pusillimonas sp. ANT_WB101]